MGTFQSLLIVAIFLAMDALEVHHRRAFSGQHAVNRGSSRKTDFTDYKNDILRFLAELGSTPDHRCEVDRTAMVRASHLWDALLWANLSKAPIEKHREHFAAKLFAKSPHAGVLSSRVPDFDIDFDGTLADTQFPIYFWSYPGWWDSNVAGRFRLRDYLKRNQTMIGHFIHLHDKYSVGDEDSIRALDEFRNGVLTDVSPVFARRPSERANFVSVDGIGSGHGFHIHESVWQTQVVGRKMWWFLPDTTSADHLYRAPVVENQTYIIPNPCAMLQREQSPPGTFSCLTGPGETVLLEKGTWHAVCALDDITVAVGGSMRK